MKKISFSVVIPTNGRYELVETLLQTLAVARNCYPGDVEILIIDSTEGQQTSKLQVLCAKTQARYLRCENNVCKKRNLGAREAKNEIVLFTDSDCEVESNIFEQHENAYRIVGKNVGGVLGLTTVFGNTAPVWNSLKFDPAFTSSFSYARFLETAPWGTCTNISFRREVLIHVGGFDNNWPLVVYGEDVDLGLRMNELGFIIKCNPSAIVKHNSITIATYKQVFRKKFLCGRADYFLGKKHPTHLFPEFPGWPALMFLLLPVIIIKCLLLQSFFALLYYFFCFWGGILFQAILAAVENKSGVFSIFHQAMVILFEATFESGRIFESVKHWQIDRFWTKFVYADRQLLGERKKRIQQMWAFLFLLFLVWTITVL